MRCPVGDEEVKNRIELEKKGSKCGSCNGMGGVARDASGAITGVVCKGYGNQCVDVRGAECAKHINLCPKKAHAYLPELARASRAAA
jgi:hypothetical protein